MEDSEIIEVENEEEELELLDSDHELQQSEYEQTDQGSSSSSVESSLLSHLRHPTSSELARKRNVSSNKPPTGQKKGKGKTLADPKSVTPSQCVLEYPDESLTVSCNSLFYETCREQLYLKKSVIELHTKSV